MRHETQPNFAKNNMNEIELQDRIEELESRLDKTQETLKNLIAWSYTQLGEASVNQLLNQIDDK